MKILIIIVILLFVSYVASCTYISSTGNSSFDKVKIGDTEENVIELFGSPSVREKSGLLFSRYTSYQCEDECVERLWFENRLVLGIQAWSFELNDLGKVIVKSYWVSP